MIVENPYRSPVEDAEMLVSRRQMEMEYSNRELRRRIRKWKVLAFFLALICSLETAFISWVFLAAAGLAWWPGL